MTQLTNLAIRRTKASCKPCTLKGGAGPYLSVNPNGTKNWLFGFYWHNRQKRISLDV